jgi:hypothetical protein
MASEPYKCFKELFQEWANESSQEQKELDEEEEEEDINFEVL